MNLRCAPNVSSPARLYWPPAGLQQEAKKSFLWGIFSIARDWGWAPEYVKAMWRILQQDDPEDYVVATGETHTLEEFVAEAFNCVGLDWREHVITDSTLLRPSEIMISRANPDKVAQRLGWQACNKMRDVVRLMGQL